MIVDTSEVRRLGADLDRAATSALGLGAIDAAVEAAARSLKDAYAAQAEGSAHFKGMAGSFSYDRSHRLGSVLYEVGPDKSRRGGALGNIFFFGGAHGGGGSGDLDEPLRTESDTLVRGLSRALGDLL